MISSNVNETKAGLAAFLGRLPEHEPDPALWLRIEAARARRRRQRRVRQGSWFGAGLAAAAVLVVLMTGLPRDSERSSEVATWRAHSHSLEQEWQAMSRGSMDPRFRAELRLIDAQLQAAYDRGAGDGELLPLWKLRSEALQDLISSDGVRMQAITRI